MDPAEEQNRPELDVTRRSFFYKTIKTTAALCGLGTVAYAGARTPDIKPARVIVHEGSREPAYRSGTPVIFIGSRPLAT